MKRMFGSTCWLCLLVAWDSLVLPGICDNVRGRPVPSRAEQEERELVFMDERPFSPAWTKELMGDSSGCSSWRTVGYEWRNVDLGDNINGLLATWVYGVAGRQREDVAVIADPALFSNIRCGTESRGKVVSGWNCVWGAMPHVCLFPDQKSWEQFMSSKGARPAQIESSTRVTFEDVRWSTTGVADRWLDMLGKDQFAAHEALVRLLMWHFTQPWVKVAVRNVLMATPAAVRQGPFVALHINRRNAVIASENGVYHTPVEEYLRRAREYVATRSKFGVAGVRGIWVTSDDPGVVEEVRAIAPDYFPTVNHANITYTSRGGVYGLDPVDVATDSTSQTFGGMVHFLVDLLQMSRAEVFVGSFTSDTARLVATVRADHGWRRSSTISVDLQDWYPLR